MTSSLRWGILSTGTIARRLAKAIQTTDAASLQAVASRDQAKADAFAAEWGAASAYGDYQALLNDRQVEAVYIATPHPQHAEWAVKAARAGKHILCEKPITMNAAEAEVVIRAARENNVFLLEAFMYRCHPQTQKLVELIREGAIGQVRLIQCAFGFQGKFNPESRLYANALGGGGIMDVGCYCASMARLVAGAALGLEVAEPLSVKGEGWLTEGEGTDAAAVAVCRFPGNILAQLSTSVLLNQPNHVTILGEGGSITLTQPWFAGEKGARLIIKRNGHEPEEMNTETREDLYAHELELVARHCREGQAPSPAMTWADTLGNMRLLDAWRREAGVVYPQDRYEAITQPLAGGKLSVRSGQLIPRKNFPGLGRDVATLVMGGMTTASPAGQYVLDDYFERGGNAIDSAYVYGLADKAIGHWMKTRGVRQDMVVVAKGAHTPFCNPEDLTTQLHKSLEALQTDYADVYIMHRDNPDIPAGEFIDVLDAHKRAGLIQAYGGSNWSLNRVAEANTYAEKHGKTPFTVVSNQLSLARMVNPVWEGCVSVADLESRAWMTERQMALMAWSSQSRGFFTTRATPDYRGDAELVRCWYSEDNFERKRRAAELAQKKNCEPINIALAWVLKQAYPVWTLIGPATTAEMASCMRALDITLTDEEWQWLNLE